MIRSRRVALITGGGTGIGAAAARRFAAADTAVAIVGRRPEPLDDTVQVIRAAGGDAIAIPADLADPAVPSHLIETVVKTWGRLDILVNNAATIRNLPFEQVTVELFDEHIAINLRAPYLLTQAALPALRESTSAVVINLSSSSGSMAIPSQSIYGTSKAALEFLTRSLAAELAPLVRVNAIAPGPTDTPIHRTWAGDDLGSAYTRMQSELPLKRMGTADEVAAWIVWLADPQASWATGVVIHVDGGQTLPGALSRIAAGSV